MNAHQVATLFPLMRDSDPERWAAFVASIRERGLIEPIVVHEGQILDGRNRELACHEAGVEPQYIEFRELNAHVAPHEYAFEKNFQRRDLTADQRAVIAAQFFEVDRKLAAHNSKANLVPGYHKNSEVTDSSPRKSADKTRQKIAKAAKVSEFKAQKAMNVQRDDPDKLAAVVRGDLTLAKATTCEKASPAPPSTGYRASDKVVRIMKWIRKLTAVEFDELASHLKTYAKLTGRSQSVDRLGDDKPEGTVH